MPTTTTTTNTPAKTNAELLAELATLKAQNEALKAKASSRQKVSLGVSVKGALSVYGLSRFPVTLYREQWEKILGIAPEITAFIAAHSAELKVKE